MTSAVGSFVGGVASKWTPERFLLLLFGIATLLVIAMMFLPAPSKELDKVPLEKVTVAPSSFVSMLICHRDSHRLSGRGQFRLRSVADLCPQSPDTNCHRQQPVYRDDEYLLGISRQACHSQIPWLIATVVVIGAGIRALVGEKIHRRLSSPILRYIYSAMVGLIAARIWLSILDFDL